MREHGKHFSIVKWNVKARRENVFLCAAARCGRSVRQRDVDTSFRLLELENENNATSKTSVSSLL